MLCWFYGARRVPVSPESSRWGGHRQQRAQQVGGCGREGIESVKTSAWRHGGRHHRLAANPELHVLGRVEEPDLGRVEQRDFHAMHAV